MRRLALAAHAARRHATSAASGGASASEGCYYETLGVPFGTRDTAAIKAAYRARAQLLHPDMSPGTDAAAFVRLARAYEVLQCPTQRALYDAQRGAAWRAAAARAAAAGAAQGAAQGDARRGPAASGDDDGALVGRAALRQQLDAALARAYHGPHVDVAAAAEGSFPNCFEADERCDTDHGDLLQLVSGRTLLGAVRHVTRAALPRGATAALPRGDARAGAHAPPLAEAGDTLWGAEAAAQLDELHLVSHTGLLVARAQRRPRQAAGATRKAPLPWDDMSGAGAGDIAIFLRDAAAAHCHVAAAGGAYGAGAVRSGATGTHTHAALLHATPWVTHLHFVGAQSGARPVQRHDATPRR